MARRLLFDEEGGGGALTTRNPVAYLCGLHSQDRWLSRGAAGRGWSGRAFARWKVGDRPDPGLSLPVALADHGRGRSERPDPDNINHSWAHWFPDGKRILFSANEPGKGVRFYVYDLMSERRQAITPEGVNGTAFVISPDSQWVAGIGPDHKGYLYPIGGGDPTLVAGLKPGEQPIAWSADGNSSTSISQVSCRPGWIVSTCKPDNALSGNSSCRPTPPAWRPSVPS